MKKSLLIIFLFNLLLYYQPIFCQETFVCNTPNTKKFLPLLSTCDYNSYYPNFNISQTPIKTIRITFHVFNKNDGTGNFPNNQQSRNWLSINLMNDMNAKMGNLQPMNLSSSSPYIQDCRIRFELANIYFWNDDDGYYYNGSDVWGNNLYLNYVTNQPSVNFKDNSVHIFINYGTTSGGRASDIGDKKWIAIMYLYQYFLNNWANSNGLVHELCHSIGLLHSWNGDDCNDTPNNSNCWNYNEPSIPQCIIPSNNIMDYNAFKSALTFCQVYKMHYFLLGNGSGNINDCVISGIEPIFPIIEGDNSHICSTLEYNFINPQLGIKIVWSSIPNDVFINSEGCGNQLFFEPVTISPGRAASIDFDISYGTSNNYDITKSLWVGEFSTPLNNVCSFEESIKIYTGSIINSPGTSCVPQNAIISNNKNVLFIGNEINLNPGFEVQIGSTFEIKIDPDCN